MGNVKYFLPILNKIFNAMDIFSIKLKELRLEKGLTLKTLSEKLGMPLRTYANYEQGIREPSLETIRALCRFYDVTADYLLGLTDSY